MYYGYNNNKELILADEAFIELLGFSSFEKLKESNIIEKITFENKQIVIAQEYQKVNSDFLKSKVYDDKGQFFLVEMRNIKIEKTSMQKTSKSLNTNYKAIYLDVEKIAESIGLSVSDYKLYLDSFIDQSIIDEKRLLEGNDKVIKNLSNLALTLKIPHINILLLKIKKLPQRERMPLIDEYYTKLALLTLEKPEDYEEDEPHNLLEEDSNDEKKEELLNARFSDLLKNVESDIEEDDFLSDNFLLEDDLLSTESKKSETENSKTDKVVESEIIDILPSANSSDVKKISLDNITPLPISYNPQKAADELNLPVVLIEEFVEDFIEQARHDKDHLLASYYQKDMDNIHELGHKLKGAASNLRINELSDILEEIQFCTEHDKLEDLFIRYWGHFLSLEDYMQQLKKA